MLDSRYVHLHEALGLGAMWLNAHAKIMPASAPVSLPMPITSVASTVAPAAVPNPTARLSALERVRGQQTPSVAAENKSSLKTVAGDASSAPERVSVYMPHAKVMVMSVCASPQDVAAGQLFSGEDGELLHKMLTAIDLSPNDVYLTTWLKGLPDFSPTPTSETVAAATARVAQEWRDCGAEYLLLLGRFFERADVLAQLATFVAHEQCFIVPHPAQMHSNKQLKKRAWAILQQMQQFISETKVA